MKKNCFKKQLSTIFTAHTPPGKREHKRVRTQNGGDHEKTHTSFGFPSFPQTLQKQRKSESPGMCNEHTATGNEPWELFTGYFRGTHTGHNMPNRPTMPTRPRIKAAGTRPTMPTMPTGPRINGSKALGLLCPLCPLGLG